MRKLTVNKITNAVREMCMETNFVLTPDIRTALEEQTLKEASPVGASILKDIVKNADIAASDRVAMCQDTGMVVVFLNIGQEVHLCGGDLKDAVNEGVRQGYKQGFLRKSVVRDPLLRENTKDNTPAVIHIDIVPGDKVHITMAPKGFGSENMSRLKMLKPSDGIKGVEEFVVESVSIAGPNPCPPIVVGVGIGGTVEKVAYLAKKALMRPLNQPHQEEHIALLEKKLFKAINRLGIGPQGLGGSTTTLGVHIETYPTHIAGLPVAVNINCHASRHMSRIV